MLSEVNIDALVGPSHHFGGLGVGNVASREHRFQTSNPKKAALEGLRKAGLVASLGVPQFVWLPPERPRYDLFSQLGFVGSLSERLAATYEYAPSAFSAAFSSAFMWAANAATITPAVDAQDSRIHVTPANLISSWHRASEACERAEDLRFLFDGIATCAIHAPLPSILPLRDEGAANHMRLSDETGMIGFNIFVHGEDERKQCSSSMFPRHTRSASETIARRHRLNPDTTYIFHQHPNAISSGVFHNDVISTSHQSLFLHHEFAFLDAGKELDRLEADFFKRTGKPLQRIEIANSQLPLADAVSSYLFNSQIISPERLHQQSPRMILICALQCQEIATARKLVEQLVADKSVPIDDVHFVPLGESMAGGGGPACLRLRASVTVNELEAMNQTLRMNSKLQDDLSSIIEELYPEQVCLTDFLNSDFVEEVSRVPAEMRTRLLDSCL